LAALSGIADHVVIVAVGTYRVQQADPWWVAAVSAYRSLTGRDPWISLMVANEWEYGPLFYRGVMHEARDAVPECGLPSRASAPQTAGLDKPPYQRNTALDRPFGLEAIVK